MSDAWTEAWECGQAPEVPPVDLLGWMVRGGSWRLQPSLLLHPLAYADVLGFGGYDVRMPPEAYDGDFLGRKFKLRDFSLHTPPRFIYNNDEE